MAWHRAVVGSACSSGRLRLRLYLPYPSRSPTVRGEPQMRDRRAGQLSHPPGAVRVPQRDTVRFGSGQRLAVRAERDGIEFEHAERATCRGPVRQVRPVSGGGREDQVVPGTAQRDPVAPDAVQRPGLSARPDVHDVDGPRVLVDIDQPAHHECAPVGAERHTPARQTDARFGKWATHDPAMVGARSSASGGILRTRPLVTTLGLHRWSPLPAEKHCHHLEQPETDGRGTG